MITYLLTDDTGHEWRFEKMFEARENGERMAAERGLQSEGWRQEGVRLWRLQPHRRYSIETCGVKE